MSQWIFFSIFTSSQLKASKPQAFLFDHDYLRKPQFVVIMKSLQWAKNQKFRKKYNALRIICPHIPRKINTPQLKSIKRL